MLVGDLVRHVRHTVQDMTADRYSDTRIIDALNLAVLDTRRARPDMFIGRFDEPTIQFTDLTELFDVPEVLIPSCIAYAVGWIEMADDEYVTDGRAAIMMKKYSGDLGVP